MASTEVGIRELLEAGVHFGHQTRRWNPKMRRFIHGERGGIYIIDLLKTETLLHQAQEFAAGVARRGGTVLFVGTKKQARDAVKEVAESCGMPYVNHRWLGGLLTNFQTISLRIKRLHDLERYAADGQLALLPTRERLAAEADLLKLQANLGGVKHMKGVPDAVFVIDLKTEDIAVREAQRLRIPVIGLVDTNCDPDGINYVIPGNDDAMKACRVIAQAIGDVVSENRSQWQAAEQERIRKEEEERARIAAEEQAKREAEEAARIAAEEAVKAEEASNLAAAQAEHDRVHGSEAQVAKAVAEAGRPQPDGTTDAEASAAVEAKLDPATVEPPAKPKRTRAKKAEPEVAAPEPGPSPVAEAAIAEAPPVETEVADAPSEAAPAPEAKAEEVTASEDTGVVEAVTDTAGDAVAAVADTAADVAEAVEKAAPGPLKTVAKAAKRASKKVAEVAGGEEEPKAEKKPRKKKTDEKKDDAK